MNLPRAIVQAQNQCVTIHLDAEFATMTVRCDYLVQEIDVVHVPCDVKEYCRLLDRKGNGRGK